MKSDATFSDDRKYRYSLTRIWDESKRLMTFCMLNPSTADEIVNDPTIERCQRRTQMMGFGGLIVVNIFAYRSTDPRELLKVEDPIGPNNNEHIVRAFGRSHAAICGWGKHGSIRGRGNDVLGLIKLYGWTPMALKINKDGSPAHPLYIGYDVQPKPIPEDDGLEWDLTKKTKREKLEEL